MISNVAFGFFFCAVLIVCTVPMLYIDTYDDKSIYTIFMVPAGAVANGLAVYVLYYRHMRHMHYSCEYHLENLDEVKNAKFESPTPPPQNSRVALHASTGVYSNVGVGGGGAGGGGVAGPAANATADEAARGGTPAPAPGMENNSIAASQLVMMTGSFTSATLRQQRRRQKKTNPTVSTSLNVAQPLGADAATSSSFFAGDPSSALSAATEENAVALEMTEERQQSSLLCMWAYGRPLCGDISSLLHCTRHYITETCNLQRTLMEAKFEKLMNQRRFVLQATAQVVSSKVPNSNLQGDAGSVSLSNLQPIAPSEGSEKRSAAGGGGASPEHTQQWVDEQLTITTSRNPSTVPESSPAEHALPQQRQQQSDNQHRDDRVHSTSFSHHVDGQPKRRKDSVPHVVIRTDKGQEQPPPKFSPFAEGASELQSAAALRHNAATGAAFAGSRDSPVEMVSPITVEDQQPTASAFEDKAKEENKSDGRKEGVPHKTKGTHNERIEERPASNETTNAYKRSDSRTPSDGTPELRWGTEVRIGGDGEEEIGSLHKKRLSFQKPHDNEDNDDTRREKK